MPPRDPKDLADSPFVPRAGARPAMPSRPSAKLQRLESLFKGGGGSPPPPVVGGRPPAAGALESRMRTERLRGATTVEEVAAASDVLLKFHEMPEDGELLCKMLRHPDAGVGERVLAQLGSLREAGRVVVTTVMREALVEFAPRCREPLARAVLDRLLDQGP